MTTQAHLAGKRVTFTDCPDCGGTGQRIALFVRGGLPDRKKRIPLTCRACAGRGYHRTSTTDQQEGAQ